MKLTSIKLSKRLKNTQQVIIKMLASQNMSYVFFSLVLFFFCLEHQKSLNSIIVMVNMCHRVDHFMSNINTLYKSKDKSNDIYLDEDVYLLGRNSLTWLLQAGTHYIHLPQSLRLNPENNYVGFFPVGSACHECTTTGLKWNIRKFLFSTKIMSSVVP